MNIFKSSDFVLFQFGFRQVLKGAIIVGLVAGGMLALQGVAYEHAYASVLARDKLAVSLSAAPGLGFLYGDPDNLYYGTQGYMVYRVLGFMGVVTAAWGLMTITKLLRGSEEDGRFEIIRAGSTTPRRATRQLLVGFAGAWWLALLLSYGITLLAVKAGGITTTASTMWLLNLAIFLPGLLFAGIGALTSQLGLTRGRALLYAMTPLALLFLARGIANTTASWHWLLYWTPFGWAQLINPVRGPDDSWLYMFVVLALLSAAMGIWLARRDYGSSIIHASTTVRSHFILLNSAWKLGLRQNYWMVVGWATGALLMISVIAGLSSAATNALQSAGGGLSKALHQLGGANNLRVAFLGAGILFMVMVLLIMSINLIGQIRQDEAKQYLDNILVAPQRRSVWLVQRFVLALTITLVISLLGGCLLQSIAVAEHITLDFAKVVATSIYVIGSVGFLMGIGILLYGFVPRITVLVLYSIIGWSFLVTLLASTVKLNTVIWHTSLFQYTNFDLAEWPDWTTFGWLIVIGCVCAVAGTWGFTRRDIVPE